MSLIATESTVYGNLVKQEYGADHGYCKEVLTVNGSAGTLAVGTVLGLVTSGTATPAADAGNAATTGTIASATATAGAKDGVYVIKITAAAANAGTFSVTDPDGLPLPNGTVAVAYSHGGLAFTVTDGAQDFIVGEGFTITVASGVGEYKVATETATDGSKVAAAIVAAPVTLTGSAEAQVLCIKRGPISISKGGLVLDATYDNATKKNTVYASLEALGIQVLETV
jgi:hypothetical protein